jgi:hypothetical protein
MQVTLEYLNIITLYQNYTWHLQIPWDYRLEHHKTHFRFIQQCCQVLCNLPISLTFHHYFIFLCLIITSLVSNPLYWTPLQTACPTQCIPIPCTRYYSTVIYAILLSQPWMPHCKCNTGMMSNIMNRRYWTSAVFLQD